MTRSLFERRPEVDIRCERWCGARIPGERSQAQVTCCVGLVGGRLSFRSLVGGARLQRSQSRRQALAATAFAVGTLSAVT